MITERDIDNAINTLIRAKELLKGKEEPKKKKKVKFEEIRKLYSNKR